jgi:hypothetical protein
MPRLQIAVVVREGRDAIPNYLVATGPRFLLCSKNNCLQGDFRKTTQLKID